LKRKFHFIFPIPNDFHLGLGVMVHCLNFWEMGSSWNPWYQLLLLEPQLHPLVRSLEKETHHLLLSSLLQTPCHQMGVWK